MDTCKECSTTGSCPFSYTARSEQAQNYGCLPTPNDIIIMRQVHNKTWACHSNPTKPCLGALKRMAELNIDYSVVDSELVTEEDDWDVFTKQQIQVS